MKVSRRDFAKIIGAATVGATAIPAFGADKTANEEKNVQQSSVRNISRRFFVGQRDGFVSGRRRGQ